ncbi:MAG: OmpA family protein [Alphaproteobacteria bacterium]|nr:OmpA family protein [Alphaproteobacteria bacterium]
MRVPGKSRNAAAFCLGAALAAGLPFALQAADKGAYVGIGVGPNWTRDSDITGNAINNTADFDTGIAAALSAGWAYGNGVRSEIEIGHRRNDVDSITGVTNGTGHARAWSGMLNVLYDFNTNSPFTPYIGGGIGMARVDGKGSAVGTTSVNDSENAFAYQGIVGVGYRLNENATLFTDYRYFATRDLDYITADGRSVDADYGNHTVLIGLRYNFAPPKPAPKEEPKPAAAPVAPPPPAPAPAPAARVTPRNYLVFFDWDKADLTAEAKQTIAQAAADAKKGNVARIRATGHADRSGPDAYNMRLSMRRAVAVKAELVRLGVADKDIALVAKGETEPLVPTPDGVREPQNRRVEIVFQ